MLRDWQVALGQLVEARSAGRDGVAAQDVLARPMLSDSDRTWLQQVARTRGFALTCLVPRTWRETRLRRSVRLTLAALGADAEGRLRDYMRAVPCFTLFHISEGLAFLEHLETVSVPAQVRAVARFERAMWNATLDARLTHAPFASVSHDEVLVRHPAAALVAFEARPELVLGALLHGGPAPAPASGLHHVLVAPGLPRLWRPATHDEVRIVRACERGATRHALTSLPDVSAGVVENLYAALAVTCGRSSVLGQDRHERPAT